MFEVAPLLFLTLNPSLLKICTSKTILRAKIILTASAFQYRLHQPKRFTPCKPKTDKKFTTAYLITPHDSRSPSVTPRSTVSIFTSRSLVGMYFEKIEEQREKFSSNLYKCKLLPIYELCILISNLSKLPIGFMKAFIPKLFLSSQLFHTDESY